MFENQNKTYNKNTSVQPSSKKHPQSTKSQLLQRILLVQSNNLQSADVLDPRTMDLVWLDTPGARGLKLSEVGQSHNKCNTWGMDAAIYSYTSNLGCFPQQWLFRVTYGHRNWNSKLSRLQYPKIFQHITLHLMWLHKFDQAGTFQCLYKCLKS